MKHLTIYIPDGGKLPYMNQETNEAEGLTTIEIIGALKAATMQIEASISIKVLNSMLEEQQKKAVTHEHQGHH